MATILIVDDRPVNREVLATILGYRKHKLLQAGDGAEALQIARAERPDLIVSDILMPTMDGFEFVRQLRADPNISQTKVIFYTADYLKHEAQGLALSCGVTQVITKPAEPAAIYEAVDIALGIVASPVQAPPAAQEFNREHLEIVTNKLALKADALQSCNQRLTALLGLSQEMALERDTNRLLQSFCRAARDIIGAKYAAIAIADKTGLLTGFVTSGLDCESAKNLKPVLQSGTVLGALTEERTTRNLHGIEQSGESLGLPDNFPRVHSIVGATIASHSTIYGWVCLSDKLGSDRFFTEDEHLVATLAAQLGRIYENGSLYTQLQRHVVELDQEIAHRKQKEAELRESEARFRQIAENIREVFFLVDPQHTRMFYVSPMYEEIWGRSCESLYSNPMSWGDAIHPEDRERTFKETRMVPFDVQYRILRPDGSMRWIRSRGFPIRNDAGEIYRFAGIAEDISERTKLEAQLRQAHKMEAIGQLAGGVAHDFNNLLTVINGRSQLMISRLKPGEKMRNDLELIYKTGEQAAALTRQLLAFSRQQILEPVVLDLNAVAADMDKMLRHLVREDIDLTTVLDPALKRVKADPGQIEQVIMNLVVNARDAMPDGGKLTIETANVELSDEYCRARTEVKPGHYAMLAISDTGHGMDAAVKARLFEPFFTTKPQGKGTGLGLAMVFGFVKQSNGHIAVHSEVGKGTTFKIYLPQTLDKPASRASESGFTAAAGKEIVLVVEDEEGIRELVRDLLEMNGYTVLMASNGKEALQLCREHKGTIHLLVTDVVMPEMGGPELVERIKVQHPETKVLFTSGYTDHAIVRHGELEAGVSFIQKPFTPANLVRKVRDVLDKA